MFKIVIAAEKDVNLKEFIYRRIGFEIHKWNWGVKAKDHRATIVNVKNILNKHRIRWTKRNNLRNWKSSARVY